MKNSFDWNALQSFLAVARFGKLTVAARRLGVDHSTLSRRISELERSLRVQLFTRGVQGYVLTPPGEKLLRSAQSIETAAFGIMGELSGSSLEISGSVRIGAPDGFGAVFLAPRLSGLATTHPDLMVELVTLPRIFNLTKREADIAIGLARPEAGRLHARKLTDYHLGLYAAPTYLQRFGTPHRRADLRAHRLIGYVGEYIYAPELDYLPLIEKGLEPTLTGSNLIAQYNMTLAGCGLCVLPSFMAAGTPGLTPVLAETVALTRSFWLIVHSDLRDVARIRVTSDFIAEQVRAAGPGFFRPDREGVDAAGG